MQSVTDTYKEQIHRPLRNPTTIEISFGLTDSEATTYSNPEDNGHLLYSSVEQFDLGLSSTKTYMTLERNRGVLNGVNPLAEYTDFMFQGYVGDALCDENGLWSETAIPTINIYFDDVVAFPALTMNFDESMNDYPTKLQLKAYLDNVEVVNEVIYPNLSRNYMTPIEFPDHDHMVIMFLENKTPLRYPRIGGIVYGFTQTFSDTDVISMDYKSSIDPISTELPTVSMSFTIVDTTQSYDPDSPTTLWDYLESGQSVQARIGYYLDNGTIEWVNICNNYTTGEVSVTNQGHAAQITFETTSLLDLLDTYYYQSDYTTTAISLYDLAENVLNSIGYRSLGDISSSLSEVYTSNLLPYRTIKECLQLIANAGMCTLSITREGGIKIAPYSTTVLDYDITLTDMYEAPTTAKISRIKTITSGYQTISVEDEETEITSQEVDSEIAIEMEFTYNGYASVRMVTSGLTVVSAEHYSYYSKVTVSGTGTLTLYGLQINTSATEFTNTYDVQGTAESIEINELIDNSVWASSWLDWLASYFTRRSSYKFKHRGFMELDVLDNIVIETNFNSELPVTVIDNDLQYNGALRGTSKGVAF